MKKNRYGSIEDNVIGLQAVTPNGEGGTNARVVTGPDMNHVMLGSEGMVNNVEENQLSIYHLRLTGSLVVVSEIALKIRPVPPVRKFASFVFPDMDLGIEFLSQVAHEVQ